MYIKRDYDHYGNIYSAIKMKGGVSACVSVRDATKSTIKIVVRLRVVVKGGYDIVIIKFSVNQFLVCGD